MDEDAALRGLCSEGAWEAAVSALRQVDVSEVSRSWSSRMTENKRTVDEYMDGFRRSDHGQILSCLTDDVEWEIPGAFLVAGKDAFDKEIENEAFVGSPTIVVTRLIEENDVVMAEGSVRTRRTNGDVLSLRFCDVFVMQAGKIKRLTSYLMEVK